MNDAVVDLEFIAGRHLRKVNYLPSACKGLIMNGPHATSVEGPAASAQRAIDPVRGLVFSEVGPVSVFELKL